MEELICKAKSIDIRLNGKMIAGFPFKHWDKSYLAWGVENGKASLVEIDPKTLCRRAFETKKGWLWEGDMFWDVQEDGIIGVIVWSDQHHQWVVELIPNVEEGGIKPDFETVLDILTLDEYENDFFDYIHGGYIGNRVEFE